MNVSDLLQDSPSQHRRRPPALQHESPPPSQSVTASLPSAPISPPSQHHPQHNPPHSHPSQLPPPSQGPYPPQPSAYYPPHHFSRQDPPPMHRITPRPSSQLPPSSIDPTPAMASLQHPSPSAPPPHVHPHTPWGPPPSSRQGSSPLSVSNLGPPARTSQHQPPAQIKPAMPGPDRSPVAPRGHASGNSTPSNIAAHSPPSKPLLTTAAGVLILDNRTADEQLARPSVQAQVQALTPSSSHPSPSTNFRSARDREKEWDRERERHQEDMDFIRHPTRERVVTGPYDRERDRDRPLASPRERSMASPHERSLVSPHDRPIPSAHDRPLAPPHDRPIPSPHERDRPHHMHRMSPLARGTPTQGPPPLRTAAPIQQSSPGSNHRMPPLLDRMPPPSERDRMPAHPHERPPHDKERMHPTPHHRHGPTPLPGQGQFQSHPPEWDPVRERERDMAVARERERERDLPMNVAGPPRDLIREKELEPTRDPEYGYPDPDRVAYPRERERQRLREPPRELHPQRERDLHTSQRDIPIPRERERDVQTTRDRDRMMERDREPMSRELENMPMPHRERDFRERELHIQRERERVAGLHHREGETGSGMPPRGHDRERERDRERRTHSRVLSPHELSMGGAGAPTHASTSTPGLGAAGPHHLPPAPHDPLMTDRDRHLAWERDREREREMDRRNNRERIPISDRELMGMPISERDYERNAFADRERATAERNKAMFERERMPLAERDRVHLDRDRMERERMLERERAYLERERMAVNDRDRVTYDRERLPPPECAVMERAGDRDRMPMRPPDMVRERREVLEQEREPERIEAIERERERGLHAASTTGAVPLRDREGDKPADVPMVERERDECLPRAEREMVERHDRVRLELLERELGAATGRERELANTENRGGEPTGAERERPEPRERFEILQREIGELVDRERLTGFDTVDRERLAKLERESFELLEHDRVEQLERDRLEMLERMPSAEELAKARKEREKKPFVSLGTFVWPRTPFPYYFPEWIPTPINEEEDKPVQATGKAMAADSSSSSLATSTPQSTSTTQIPTELRLTVLVPPSFLPPARPQKFRLWGGGLPPPPPFPYAPSVYSYSRRRVYTDDSDVIQCAVHAGLLTWSGIARAKKDGRTIRVVLALVPTLASASGAVNSGQGDSRATTSNLSANGHVNGTASVPRTRTNTPLPLPPPPAPLVPSISSSNNEPQPPGYAGGVWASRFIGGWGESFYGEESAGRGDSVGRMTSFEEAEDDGRGCVSCGWGWGHDGSAFEVISVDVVEPNAHVAPGLGIRNRAQRLAEYAQRRADILGLAPPPSPPLFDVTNAPKKRRLNVDFTEMKKAGLGEMTAIAEEAKKMQAMTISFGVADRRKCKTGIGFKYDAQVVQSALFPHLHGGSVVSPPPAKRRKTTMGNEAQADGNVEMDSPDKLRRGVVLECSKETYLVTRSQHEGKERYTLSVFEPPSSDVAQACIPISLTLSADAPSKTHATPVAEASQERKTPDGPPASGSATDPPASATPPDTPSEPKATSSKPTSMRSSPEPTVRVLRLNLSEADFSFENDMVVIGKSARRPSDDGDMDVDADEPGDAFAMRVLRWRWHSRP